jgi:hypothetical protein
MEKTYLVRQYRPNYFSGFTNKVVRDVNYDDIINVPWADNFRHSDFEKFTIEPYGKELIISAHYKDGKSWVVGFAVDSDAEFAKDWRYQEHES